MRQYIDIVARQYSLAPELITTIVRVESAGDRFAWNPEPPYRYLWDVARNAPFRALTEAERASERPPLDFVSRAGDRDAEWWGQQASWGLMQVMGGVAREFGFKGHFPALCDPLDGLHYGCKLLAQLRDKHLAKWGWRGVVAAYNAGSPRLEKTGNQFENQQYVDKIAAAGGPGVFSV